MNGYVDFGFTSMYYVFLAITYFSFAVGVGVTLRK